MHSNKQAYVLLIWMLWSCAFVVGLRTSSYPLAGKDVTWHGSVPTKPEGRIPRVAKGVHVFDSAMGIQEKLTIEQGVEKPSIKFRSPHNNVKTTHLGWRDGGQHTVAFRSRVSACINGDIRQGGYGFYDFRFASCESYPSWGLSGIPYEETEEVGRFPWPGFSWLRPNVSVHNNPSALTVHNGFGAYFGGSSLRPSNTRKSQSRQCNQQASVLSQRFAT